MRSKFKWIFSLLMIFSLQIVVAQDKTITGTVRDQQGAAIAGANISVIGTAKKAQSDFDGKYTIKASTGDKLLFTFVGMQELTRTVNAGTTLNVVLNNAAKELTEVVIQSGVVGVKKTANSVTYAQRTVGNKELTNAVNPSAVFSLQGKVSGLQISNTSNGVAANARILIRAPRSISGSNDALVVIDNAISTAQIFGQLPPETIESVTVIKGAQGAAIYGAQGSNGAVIVTTKRGSKSTKMTVSVNSSVDFETALFVPKTQQTYGQGWAADPGFRGPGLPNPSTGFVPWENGSWGPAFVGAGMPGIVPVGLPQADGKFLESAYAPIKDNLLQFFQTGTVFQNGFTINVGGADSYTNFSYNRQNSDFMVAGDQLVRNTFLLKSGKKFGKFNIEGNFNYISETISQTDPDLFDDLIQTASNVPVSRFRNSAHQHHWTVYAKNPWARAQQERFDDRTNTLNAILNMSNEFSKNFSINFLVNANLRFTDSQSHVDAFNSLDPTYSYNIAPYTYGGDSVVTYDGLGGQPTTSNYFAGQTGRTNIYSDLVFNFNFDLTSKLQLKYNIGANIQDRLSRRTTQGGTNLDVAGFYQISNVLNPANPSTLPNNTFRTRAVAGFVNVDLNYDNYLFLNATVRAEQQSILKNSYVYPSVGISFVPTKAFEALKDSKVLNALKLTASYTSVGDVSPIGTYQTNPLTRIPTGFPFGPLGALEYNFTPTNPNIKPQFINTTEAGISGGLFNDRITFEGSIYRTVTDDLMTNVTSSRFSGNSATFDNIGTLNTDGFEIDLGLTPIKTDSFRWDMKANYTAFKTVISKLAPGLPSVSLQQNAAVGIFAEEGEQFPLIKGTTFVRDGNGNIVVNASGVPQVSSAFSKLGQGAPDFILGFSNSFEYKGLRLSAVADLRMGASAYSFAKNLLFFTGGDLDTDGFDRTKGYFVPGGVTAAGAPNTVPFGNTPSAVGVLNYFTTTHRQVGEANIVDASALTIREIALSYSLDKKFLQGTGIESCRFGINARNPFIFLAGGGLIKARNGSANNGYFNPEASNTAPALGPLGGVGTGNAQGIVDIGQYPSSKTYGVSFNLSF